MKSDSTPLNGKPEDGTVYIPFKRDQHGEQEEKQVVLSVGDLPPDHKPMPRPYQLDV